MTDGEKNWNMLTEVIEISVQSWNHGPDQPAVNLQSLCECDRVCLCVLVMCQECGRSAALTHSCELWAVAALGLVASVCFTQEMKRASPEVSCCSLHEWAAFLFVYLILSHNFYALSLPSSSSSSSIHFIVMSSKCTQKSAAVLRKVNEIWRRHSLLLLFNLD